MKKISCFILFFLFAALMVVVLNFENHVLAVASTPQFTIECEGNIIEVQKAKTKLSGVREKVTELDFEDKVKVLGFAYEVTHSEEKAIEYVFPEIVEAVNELEKKVRVLPVSATLKTHENSGDIFVEKSKTGIELEKTGLFLDIFYKLNNFFEGEHFKAETKVVEPSADESAMKRATFLRGEFKTSFASSKSERKNNIRLALASLDGKVVLPGEELSFNKATGERGESAGYQKAKIIKNGTFVYEFGGGVCQASTTLYNAALVAGLDIVEVHPHSLPVSYVEPCFDAMVNSGSSDLAIKNNTSRPIMIATKVTENDCTVRIYGEKKDFEVVRLSEKTEELCEFVEEKTTDYEAFGFASAPKKGEEKIVSFFKPGIKAKGSLAYYKNGVLYKTKVIRENTYKPTKQIVLVAEEK